MDTITVGSRHIVLHFREVLEAVLRGQVVIITHYRQPKAALVPFALWQQGCGEAGRPPAVPPGRQA